MKFVDDDDDDNNSNNTKVQNVRRLQWHKLQERVYREKMRTVEELQQRITEEWERLDQLDHPDNAVKHCKQFSGSKIRVKCHRNLINSRFDRGTYISDYCFVWM